MEQLAATTTHGGNNGKSKHQIKLGGFEQSIQQSIMNVLPPECKVGNYPGGKVSTTVILQDYMFCKTIIEKKLNRDYTLQRTKKQNIVLPLSSSTPFSMNLGILSTIRELISLMSSPSPTPRSSFTPLSPLRKQKRMKGAKREKGGKSVSKKEGGKKKKKERRGGSRLAKRKRKKKRAYLFALRRDQLERS